MNFFGKALRLRLSSPPVFCARTLSFETPLPHHSLLSVLRLIFTDRFVSFYAIYDGRRTSSIYTLPAKPINYKMRFSPFEDKKSAVSDAF